MMPPMSDHDTWNMFFAAVVTGWSAHFGYLDDESIELCAKDADALLAESKKRETPAEPTPPQPDDDGWIKWEGGGCPVHGNAVVAVRFRDGGDGTRPANSWRWDRWGGDSDIIAYKVVTK